MDFSTINSCLVLARILLNHFLPYRKSFSTNYSLPCLSNNVAKAILLIPSLKTKKNNVVGGKATHDDFAGNANPHYVLFCDYYGDEIGRAHV